MGPISEAGGERVEQVDEVVQGQLGHYKSADWVDKAEKNHMEIRSGVRADRRARLWSLWRYAQNDCRGSA
jgi:hypothetical protein